ncbi:MAG: molybdenum cofactor guanylyltransferase [Phycisphaerales bacterium]|nr:molybdenum cofactor guanylyltransferase [Phycisphaerales bacterium]
MAFDPASITPVVLVGGRSRRFGRDKLREVIDDSERVWLVDRPIAALREVFGPRVHVVGECDAAIAARADASLHDPYQGVGPLGGILAALESTRGGVFVLSGDLVSITPLVIRQVLDASLAAQPHVLAVLASSDRIEPCIGVYTPGARPYLAQSLAAGRRALIDAIPRECLLLVPVDPAVTRNVNRPGDLPGSA